MSTLLAADGQDAQSMKQSQQKRTSLRPEG